MPRFYCPAPDGVYHDWSEGAVDESARPALRLCPEHDGTPSAGVQPLPPGEEAIGEVNKPTIAEAIAALQRSAYGCALAQMKRREQNQVYNTALVRLDSIPSAEVSPEAKALWGELRDTLVNEKAWAIIVRHLKAAEERGAGRERLRLALPPNPSERGV